MNFRAKKQSIAILALSFLIAESHANGSWTKETANDTILEYKTIRNACTISQGDQRRRCFAKLSKLTEGYKGAKRFLETKSAPKTDLADRN